MSFKDYKSRTNRYINPDAGLSKKQIEQRNKYRNVGNTSFAEPLNKKQLDKIAKDKKKADDLISYKDNTINRYKLGPLDKVLKYDKKPTKGLLTLNSIINFGTKYKNELISEVYIKDKGYLIHVSKIIPAKFSPELLNILK